MAGKSTIKKSAFFYGTLMHPKILRTVIGNKGTHLKICPALLKGYTRHKVHDEEYPGMVSHETGRKLLDRELEPEERCVRGTLVIGLSSANMKDLDAFEGSDYIRQTVLVHQLEEPRSLASFEEQDKDLVERIVPAQAPPIDDLMADDCVEAETYLYQDVSMLEPALWSFEEFMGKNAWKWYGGTEPGEAENGG